MSSNTSLPPWNRVLAVVAHPDDESFGLGAVLSTFVAAGSRVDVVCFTRGEASTLHAVEGDLAQIRTRELRNAADALGLGAVDLHDHPDGGLAGVPVQTLVAECERSVGVDGVDGVLVFAPNGITGHPDHIAATQAGIDFGLARNTPVLGWALPADVAAALSRESGAPFAGVPPEQIDITITVDRATQLTAIDCHPSQVLPGAVLWRRLELLGDRENLVWLSRT